MLSDNTKRRKRHTSHPKKEDILLPQTTTITTKHSSNSTRETTLVQVLIVSCIFAIAYYNTITTASSPLSQPPHDKKTITKITTKIPPLNRTIPLNPHLSMPILGFGTCCRPSANGDQIYQSTLLYLQHGGRLIDTAMAYNNHHAIGRAIHNSGIPRGEIWITSKLMVGAVEPENTLQAVNEILKELGGLSYLNLLLIHTPRRGKKDSIKFWENMIKIQQMGKLHAIGVSNFNKREILDLYEATNVMPAINQIQYHPWTPKEWKDQVKWQKDHGIQTTAYTSLGGARFDHSDESNYPPVIETIATKYHVSMIHIMLQWALQQDVAVIPGATSEAHILENLSIPKDLELSMDDMRMLEESDAPKGWFHGKKGPNKVLGDEAADVKAWTGDHSIMNK